MNELIHKLLEHLRGTSAGTKLIALLAGAGLVVVIGVAGVISKRPDYQLTFSGLTDHEVAKVNKALAQAGIPFTSSSPPGPFNVYVDESDRSAAFAAAYGAGALDKPLQGILNEDGVASVFNSAEERRQGVRKKEWQEMERMLQSLEFVTSAYVRTSPRNDSPIRSRTASPASASVVLRTRGALTQSQQDTIAKMVSNGLGVGREHLVISDHDGNTLYDGSELLEETPAKDHLEQQLAYDEKLTDRANELLAAILGPGKAHVTVTSEWNYEQSTSRSESPVGKGALLEERKSSSDRPIAAMNDAAGMSANLPPDSGGAGIPQQRLGSAPTESTTEENRTYRPAISVEEKVKFVPVLERLVVALYLDESIAADKVAELTATVKASVGFDDSRKDQFSSVSLAFFAPASSEDGVSAEDGETAESAPNAMVETLLRRGVELLTAGAFLFLLLRTLKTSKQEAQAAQAQAQAADEVDPELLARAHVEELMKSDPERVGELLSTWALEEQASA